MRRVLFGPAMNRWPRIPEPTDPETVRLRKLADLGLANTHIRRSL